MDEKTVVTRINELTEVLTAEEVDAMVERLKMLAERKRQEHMFIQKILNASMEHASATLIIGGYEINCLGLTVVRGDQFGVLRFEGRSVGAPRKTLLATAALCSKCGDLVRGQRS